ncbi:MAG TPA: YbaB/EbfC family nucleoid-associated protein [Treponema sp.]|nr:YbaB/EbfC family nucleoid-associated protein [Treponema sp.]
MNPFEILSNAKGLKEKLRQAQEDLMEITASGSSGGGIVNVTINGNFDLISIAIDPIAVDPRDIPMLQDLIVAAHNDAVGKVRETAKDKLGSLAGGMLPI